MAAAALDAVDQQRFLVLPPEWVTAVQERGRRLAAGEAPGLPTPEF